MLFTLIVKTEDIYVSPLRADLLDELERPDTARLAEKCDIFVQAQQTIIIMSLAYTFSGGPYDISNILLIKLLDKLFRTVFFWEAGDIVGELARIKTGWSAVVNSHFLA